MAKFLYKVKDKNAEIQTGIISAFNIEEAASKLERNGLIVLEITEQVSSSAHRNLPNVNKMTKDTMFSVKEKLEFFNSFYYLYRSGLSVSQIFASMLQSSNNPNIRGLCLVVLKKIEKGYSLQEAFCGLEHIIGIAYTQLIIAGERSGKIEDILLKMIQNIKREEELKRTLISSMTYPLIIFAFAIAVFLLFKWFILKVFAMMGEGLGQSCVIKMLIETVFKILCVFSIVIGAIVYSYKNKKIFKKILNFFSKFPLISTILKNFSFSNFFSVLALSYDAGVPISQGLELASSIINVPSIRLKVLSAAKRIKDGCEVTTAFKLVNVFSSFAISQVSSGEQAGELEKMFAVVAKDYEKQIELSIKVLAKVVEPIMIIFVAFIVLHVATTAYKSYYANLLGNFGL